MSIKVFIMFFLMCLITLIYSCTETERSLNTDRPREEVEEVDQSKKPQSVQSPDSLSNAKKSSNPRVEEPSIVPTAKVEESSPKATRAIVDDNNMESKQKSIPFDSSTTLIETDSKIVITSPKKDANIAEIVHYPNHKVFDELLLKGVKSSGLVDYKYFLNNQTILDEYLRTLEYNHPLPSWKPAEVKAYWINAYNAFTIKLILKNWPLKSITDLYGGDPWELNWINLGNEIYSLNKIEHGILRNQYDDPRIHFAVNCASISCPPLHNRAFTSENLNTTLNRLTRRFVNNTLYNQIDAEKIKVSKIFDWYAEDFGDLAVFLATYSNQEINQELAIAFLPYNWSLNNTKE